MMSRFSIAGRLAAMFALTAAVVFGSVAVLLYHVISGGVREQIRSELIFQHKMLDPMLAERGTPEAWQLVRRKLDGMQESGRIHFWIVSDDPDYRRGSPFEFKKGKLPVDGDVEFVRDPDNERIWCVMTRTIAAYGLRPALRFVIAIDATAYIHTKESFVHIMRIAATLGILIVAALGYWITRIGLRPVRELSREANALPPNDPRRRLSVHGAPPEIRELAVSFNNSLSRREAAWRQLEGFNADVAHELRTPLTNLIGQTQVALRQPRSNDELQDLLASNLEELDRISSIVNDMLFLSCAENGNRASELSRISLAHEAGKTADYLEGAFAERDMAVQIDGDGEIVADRRLFHRALGNLLSNSARYADAGSTVRVSLSVDGDFATIEVSDQGPAIPPEQQARLFERFYRADAARTHSGAHHGLGLSIVLAIARMHGGDAFVRSEAGVNTFGFTLARSPEPA